MPPTLSVLQQELHARPHPICSGAVSVRHRAYFHQPVADLVAWAVAVAADLGAQVVHDLPFLRAWSWAGGEFRIEAHNEFATLTWIGPQPGRPFADAEGWPGPFAAHTARLPDACVVDVHLELRPSPPDDLGREDLIPLFGDHQFLGGRVSDGMAAIWSSFLADESGAYRLLVQDFGLSPRRCGRLVQRCLDIVTYLHLALIGLGEARAVNPDLIACGAEVDRIVGDIADPHTPTDERALLDRLSNLSARLEHLRARTARRFAATAAYGDITRDRLAELRERKIAGFQTVGEFLSRRLSPGLRTVTAVRTSLDDLARRQERCADLLRTRIDVRLAEQNQALLASVDRRAGLQLRLQETVEGLSVVVISYYLVGLIKYLAAAAKPATHLDSDLAAGIAVPVVVLAVFLMTRRLRRRLHARAEIRSPR